MSDNSSPNDNGLEQVSLDNVYALTEVDNALTDALKQNLTEITSPIDSQEENTPEDIDDMNQENCIIDDSDNGDANKQEEEDNQNSTDNQLNALTNDIMAAMIPENDDNSFNPEQQMNDFDETNLISNDNDNNDNENDNNENENDNNDNDNDLKNSNVDNKNDENESNNDENSGSKFENDLTEIVNKIEFTQDDDLAKMETESINTYDHNLSISPDDDNNKDEDNLPSSSVVVSSTETSRKINTLYPEPIDFSELQPLETSPELDSLCKQQMDKFINKGVIPEPDQQQRLIQYVQRQKVNAIVSNSYKEAAKYQTTIQNLLQMIGESQQRESIKRKTDEIQSKISETLSKIEDHNKETENVMKNEKNKLELKKEEILKSHDIEMQQFEEKWNDEEFLRKFTKPSANLLKKQTLLHSLILTKDFDKAETVRIEIEELERTESEAAQKRAEIEMLKEQRKVEKKQQNELDTFEDYSQRQIEIITREQEQKLAPLLARQKKLDSELNALKQMKPTVAPLPSLQPTNISSSAPSSSLDVMTPRTIQRFSAYKTQIRNPRLTVKPLGPIVKNKRKNPRLPSNY